MSKKIKCPKCGGETTLGDNIFKPFCSERCQISDLGAWADGSYFIAGDEQDITDEAGNDGEITYH